MIALATTPPWWIESRMRVLRSWRCRPSDGHVEGHRPPSLVPEARGGVPDVRSREGGGAVDCDRRCGDHASERLDPAGNAKRGRRRRRRPTDASSSASPARATAGFRSPFGPVDLRKTPGPTARSSTSPPRGPRSPDYLPPILTVSWLRPRRRRALRTLRPLFVFMRERNPCLFERLRLRGLYVGFI